MINADRRALAILFGTGLLQVFLVTVQTWLIARGAIGGVFVVGVLISLTWTFNVKRAAFGGWRDRVAYSAGAGCGAVIGLWLARAVVR